MSTCEDMGTEDASVLWSKNFAMTCSGRGGTDDFEQLVVSRMVEGSYGWCLDEENVRERQRDESK